MRPVKRGDVAAPRSLTQADGPGKSEAKLARAHYRSGAAGSFPGFGAYKGDDVAEAMAKLFHGKCAYCETFHSAGAPTDVEHYRPKAGVSEDARHRGYWWLAADWDNLLPSCILCNRRNGLRIASAGMSRAQLAATAETTVGKGNQFPIRGRRARGPRSDHKAEDALLIDPARSDPARHLCWPEAGLSLVAPRFHGRAADPYGTTTIEVLGLNRQHLVEARTDHLAMVQARLAGVEARLDDVAYLPPDRALAALAQVEAALDDIQALAQPQRPYSAMVGAYLQERLKTLLARNRALLAQVRRQRERRDANKRAGKRSANKPGAAR